ncbi:MAG: hypothetical protein JSS49_18220 [Planctomycetes bacterium]|nr:hypothetical protein [Planctomycetota bacterium]
MPRESQELEALIKRGASPKVIEFFQGATDAERRSLASMSEKLIKALTKDQDVAKSAVPPAQQKDAARLAALATCSLSTLISLDWRVPLGDAASIQVLSDRRPDWLQEFAERLLEREPFYWTVARQMMKAGLVARPQHENYLLGMTHLFTGVGGSTTDPTPAKGRTSSHWNIATHLHAEPDLLNEIWRLFEIEGFGEFSLAAHDKYSHTPERRWDHTLVQLSHQGVLPRDRLLDASLDALDRGFAQFRAGWFSAFHEQLQPTLEERQVRCERYLRLLASPISPTISFALQALAIIDTGHPIDSSSYLESLRPLMLASTRGTVKSALKVLDTIAKRDSTQRSRVALMAAEALTHVATDVQSAAFKVMTAHGSPAEQALLEAVSNAKEQVAASLRKSLHDWLSAMESDVPRGAVPKVSEGRKAFPSEDVVGPEQLEQLAQRIEAIPQRWRTLVHLDEAFDALRSGRCECTAIDFTGTEIPRLDAARRIPPVETLDELIDLAAQVIEQSDDADQNERLLEGISRLCDQRPADFDKRTGPLLKRVCDLKQRHALIPFTGHAPASDIVGVIAAWLTGTYGTSRLIQHHGRPTMEHTFHGSTYLFPAPNLQFLGGAMSLRMQQLADRVAQQVASRTLCAPTHAGGWVDPIALVERAADPHVLAQASDLEKVLALLRLAPDRRDVALSRLPSAKDEFVDALRYALGGKVNRIGPTSWLWVAAARGRTPFADDLLVEQAHPDLGPDAATAARPSASVTSRTSGKYTFHELSVAVLPMPTATDLRLLTVQMWTAGPTNLGPEFVSATAVAQLFQIWPLAQESACAQGATVLGRNLDWSEAEWHNRGYLTPLLDPDLPLKPMALLMLVLGLAAREPGESGLATDVAISAISDGRLDGSRLGSTMASLLPTGLIKSARWAKTLQAISKASALHVEVVRDAISGSLRGNPKSMPKDLHALVELLKELVAESRSAVDADTRLFLQQVVGTTKLGKASKAILAAVPELAVERTKTIQRQIVESRLARVERWCERVPGERI